jgi:adenylate kinase family enzyme
MRRISVVGNSGSGKTTLARHLARRLGAPHIELDAWYHQRDWQPLPVDEFRRRVAAVIAGDTWVIDGNYSAVRDLIWTRADTVVWFDLPRPVVMWQVVSRTIARTVTRAELWNGNREPLRNLTRLDPQESIVAWSWTKHREYRERYARAARSPEHAHLRFVRVGSRREARRLVRSQPV